MGVAISYVWATPERGTGRKYIKKKTLVTDSVDIKSINKDFGRNTKSISRSRP